MPKTADLLTVLYDIDRLKGKICATCNHWSARAHGSHCRRGHEPCGADDVCEEWQPQSKVCGSLLK